MSKYFSVLSLAAFDPRVGRPAAVIPNSVWVLAPETKTIQPVITRADALTPNGVSVGADFRHLYLTDTSETLIFGGGDLYNNTGSPAIYRFDITRRWAGIQ
ncbi:hypothetical protein BDW59DRAFT_167504 [Aspergillus cavernicola]|uniref:SMP-30/Gluconolactonase/LRE-like region domain-containing protein n=1 Tax=Aspergillus cavernicola TaxID=176166 RepID=A0ABR4HDC1_9EURO